MPPIREPLLTKTKIVATVGPASSSPETLRDLIAAGVDVFRLNFAHGTLDEKAAIVADIRRLAAEQQQPIGILGDLSGPKIRLGPLPEEGLFIEPDREYAFVPDDAPRGAQDLTTTYAGLLDDLQVGDRVLLADGTVALEVSNKQPGRAVCRVLQPGRVLTRQGVNLPGSRLSISSLTPKDLTDLEWALEHGLDFIGLSFVRQAVDIRDLRARIEATGRTNGPFIVAKIEKPEAIDNLDDILNETDIVMVARGDLGVEVDIVQVPILQKQIIAACNRRRVPVITATQMLESMVTNDLPTRAEATDVANAVLDGADAVMLSGETAMGKHPARVVQTMSRITREAEQLLLRRSELPLGLTSRNTATEVTIAVTLAAIQAAERLQARLLVLQTRSGITASAVSELRSRVPILALTGTPQTAAHLTLTWGVHAVVTEHCQSPPPDVSKFVEDWGRQHNLLSIGDRFVLVGATDWSRPGKDLMLVCAVS